MDQYTQNPNPNEQNEKKEQAYTWQNPSPYTSSYTGGYTQSAPKPPKKPRRKLKGVEIALISVGALAVALLIAVCVLISMFVVNDIDVDMDQPDNSTQQNVKDEGNNVNLPALQTQPPSTDALTIPQICQKAEKSVVSIIVTIMDSQQIGQGSGTGIILSEDGYISTNAHVVNGATTIKVVLSDETEYEATLVGADSRTDIAVLKIDAKGLTPAEFGDSDKVVKGETVVAIGSPYGLELSGTVTSGIVSAADRQMVIENVYMSLIQIDASINPGNSGGPLVNSYGQVIGITSSKIVQTGYEGIGFAIPITGATEIIEELIQYGYIKDRPSIGIYGRNMDETYSKLYNIPQGVYVELVNPDSDANKKGLKKGDIITAVNGVEIDSMAALDAEKNKYKPGDTITLKVFRNSKYLEISVVLSEASEE